MINDEIVKIVEFSSIHPITISNPGTGLSFTFRHCCFVEYEQTADAAKALKVGLSLLTQCLTSILSIWMEDKLMDKKLW